MGRIKFSDKTKPRIDFGDESARRRLTNGDIEKALGAEYIGEAPKGGNHLTAYAIRNAIVDRLRSKGGRPALEGTDLRPKVPMRQSSWEKLEVIAKAVETDSFHPTPSQVASVLIDIVIKQYDTEKTEVERRVRELASTE